MILILPTKFVTLYAFFKFFEQKNMKYDNSAEKSQMSQTCSVYMAILRRYAHVYDFKVMFRLDKPRSLGTVHRLRS